MKARQTIGLVIVLAVALVSCGGGISEEELAAETESLVEAHEALEDWQFRVEAGLNYGEVLSDWPDTSAEVRRNLDLDALDGEVLGDDLCDVLQYATQIALVHDSWGDVREAVREYIQDDALEQRIVNRYEDVRHFAERLDELKTYALTPGVDSEDCQNE